MQPTLFLSSAGIQPGIKDTFLHLLPKEPQTCVAGFIPNAADPIKDKSYIEIARRQVLDCGVNIMDIDLKGQTEHSLLKRLSSCDVIFVNGGNTLYLLDVIRKSGFDKIISTLLDRGKIYVGISAGSYIACPTIDVAAFKRHDNLLNLTDLRALNLVPFYIFAHYSDLYKNLVKKESEKLNKPLVALTDKQAVVVHHNEIRVVGEGERHFYNGFAEKMLFS